jgi:hypothetical protein
MRRFTAVFVTSVLLCACTRVARAPRASEAGLRDAAADQQTSELGLDDGTASPQPVYAYQGAGHIKCPEVVAHPKGYALAWLEVGADATTSVWLALLDSSGAPRAQPKKISGADVVTTCPRILLADDELSVFWNRSPYNYKIVHTAFLLDGQQRLAPHEEAAGAGASALQVGWSGTAYGVALNVGGGDGRPAFRSYDRDFTPSPLVILSATTGMYGKNLCAAGGRHFITYRSGSSDEGLEAFVLASDGSIAASNQLKKTGAVVALVCGGARALMVTATEVGFWQRQHAYQLDADTLDVLDGPLLVAELALESAGASGVTADSGWLLAFETRASTAQTQIQLAALPMRNGFGLRDGGIGADSSLPRFDSSLPRGLDIQTFGHGYRPRMALAPQQAPLLVFIDNTQQPQRLVSYFVP